MKKFIAMILAAVMLLGMISAPAFAADLVYVQRLTDDFESGEINSEYWKSGSTLTVDTKATADSAGNKAAKLCGSDGQSYMYNYQAESCTQLDISGRAIYEFDFLIDALGANTILPFLQLNVLTTDVDSDGKQNDYFEIHEILLYDEKTGTINVRQADNVKAAGTELALGEWAHIRVDADFSTATYRVYVNDNILKSSTGESEFFLYRTVDSQRVKVNPADIVKVPMIRIDTYNNTNVFWIDNVDFRAAVTTDTAGDNVMVMSGTVANGDTEVDIKPQLSYTFSHELNPETIKNISFNGDSSYVKSAVLSDDKKTIDIELAKNLAYGTTYTLDFGFTEAAYGSLVNDTITFSTLSAENLFFDDFEADTINSKAWAVSTGTDSSGTSYIPVTLADDPIKPGNQVIHLYNSPTQGARIDNYNGAGDLLGAFTPGDVLVEFDMLIDSAISRETFNFFNAICTDSNMLMQFQVKKDDGSYNICMFENGVYRDPCANVKVNEWHTYAFVIDPVNGKYSFYLDDNLLGVSSLKNFSSDLDCLKWTRFQLYKGEEYYGVCLDNIKIARNMWLTNGGFYDADGKETDVIAPECTTYKASIINRAPVAENMKLYLATYSADGKELKGIIIKDVTVPAGKTATVEHSFENLGDEAHTSMIKAIFVKNEDSIEPYRTALGFTPEELLPGQN